MSLDIVAYTDGACSGNPGPGGWGAVLIAKKDGVEVKRKELCGGEADTTNNRMEIMAAISALNSLEKSTSLKIITDSAYLKNGVCKWLPIWIQNSWRKADKKSVKNQDLWQKIADMMDKHKVEWVWVKGHNGDPGNEAADELARKGMEKFKYRNR